MDQFDWVDLSKLFPFVKDVIHFGDVLNAPPPLSPVQRLMQIFVRTIYFRLFLWIRNDILPFVKYTQHGNEAGYQELLRNRDRIFAKLRAFGKEASFQLIEQNSWPRHVAHPSEDRIVTIVVSKPHKALKELDPEFELLANDSDQEVLQADDKEILEDTEEFLEDTHDDEILAVQSDSDEDLGA